MPEIQRITARYEANTTRLEAGVARARQTVDRQGRAMEQRVQSLDSRFSQLGSRFGQGLMAGLAAAVSVAAVRRLFSSFETAVKKLDEVAKTADSIGIATDALQELRFAADLSGISAEELNASMKRFARTASDAANGLSTAERAFETVGVKVTDANGNLKDLDVLLEETADGFAGMQNATQRAATAQELFGRSGTKMVNILRTGSEGIRAMRQEARDLGIVISEDLVRDAEKMNDELTRVFTALEARWNSFLLTFGRGLDRIFDFIPDDTETALAKRIDELAEIQDTLARRSQGIGVENFLAGPTANLEQRQEQLLQEIRALENLRQISEATSGLGEDTTPVTGGGASEATKKTFADVLELLDREAAALEERIALVGLSTKEQARFLAENQALNLARENGIELGERERELIRQFADDVGHLAEMEEELLAKEEELARQREEGIKNQEEAARANEALASSITAVGDEIIRVIDQGGSLRDILVAVIEQLLRMSEVQNLLIGGVGGAGGGLGSIFSSVLGAIGIGGGGVTTAANNPFQGAASSLFASTGSVALPFAKGGIVRRPTVFPMANGVGLMGEAGAEAILPLARGSDGRLGVKSQGRSVSFGQVTFNINAPDEATGRKAAGSVRRKLAEMTGEGREYL